MKAVNWAAMLPFLAAQWLHYDFARQEVPLLLTPGNIRDTMRGVQHQEELPVLTSVPCRRSLSA